jgi:Transposase DDE domain
VAAGLSACAADAPSLAPMLDAVATNCGRPPRQLLADAGYFSEDNVAFATGRAVDALIATGRHHHHETPPPAPRGRIPADATVKQRMARKCRTKKGRAAYARRKAIVEPVFGQMQTLQDGGCLLLRGGDGARAEWILLCACHNLRKLFGFTTTAGRAGRRDQPRRSPRPNRASALPSGA